MRKQNLARIRSFEISDVDAVHGLIHHTIDKSYSPLYPPRAVQFFKDFHSKAKIIERHQQENILVAQKDGKIIATGAIIGNNILGLFVNPEFQYQGHGKCLMQALEKRAAINGIKEVMLSVSIPSRKFYESLGYAIIEDCTIDVGENQFLNYCKAKKTLIVAA